MPPIAKLVLLTLCMAMGSVAQAGAATLVSIGQFDQPIFVVSAPASPDDLLVVERQGRVIRDDSGVRSLYGDLTGLVSCCESERGLLSIAPAPDFAASGRFYAAYTGTAAAGGALGDVHLDSFRPAPAGGGALIREPILAIGHAEFPNHNGGQLEFGPDGHLYMSLGDGGSGGDPSGHAQSLDSLLGKILRIDPRPGAEPPYVIPSGNPFASRPGSEPIWAYGLRNPWRFSFDRLSGDTVIADVGQGEREEVDLARSPSPATVGGAGANYGWNCREGFIAYSGAPSSCPGVGGFTDPVFDYPHSDPGGGLAHGCAIVGGYVVHDPNLAGLDGRYVYTDYCTGDIRSLALPASAAGSAGDDRSTGLAVDSPSSFGEDSCGRLYVAVEAGTVYRIEGSAGAACPPVQAGPPQSRVVATVRRARSRLHVRLQVRRRGARVALLTVAVSPCGDNNAGAIVQLKRGGRSMASKRLSRHCRAHFRVRVAATATFRAVVDGQRSQVRTIALAKPRP